MIAERLTGFEHRTEQVPANYLRIEQDLRKQDNACFAGFLKTPERERHFVFSQAYRIMLPIELLVPSSRPGLTTAEGRIDLRALLDGGHFRLGVLGGRRYGPHIDSILDDYSEDRVVYRRYAEDQLDGLLGMMATPSRGVDGVLAYPNEVAYRARALGLPAQAIAHYPLLGGPAYQLGYIACSDSAVGRQAIREINGIIAAIRQPVAQAYAEHLEDAARGAYLQQVEQTFGPSPVAIQATP
ncbi:MAG: hypothetical protein GAK45_02094 [Pseudomonas citronellolis]|nr:MAG: hypothetical protein GAK45_02094 [Pseudomonas citronellolis]